jgi:hypothetical protein
MMWIDTVEWVRFPDVELYAEKRRISLHDAVIELANKGLSHWDFPADGPYWEELGYIDRDEDE